MGKPDYIFISRHVKPVCFWSLRFRYGGKIIFRCIYRDDKYGSSEQAIQEAIKKRDSIAKKIGIDLDQHWYDCRIKKYRYVQKISKRCKTGVPGVQLARMGSTDYYRASICFEKYVETIKNFNCKRLGYEKALLLAIKQRKEWEKQLLKGNK